MSVTCLSAAYTGPIAYLALHSMIVEHLSAIPIHEAAGVTTLMDISKRKAAS